MAGGTPSPAHATPAWLAASGIADSSATVLPAAALDALDSSAVDSATVTSSIAASGAAASDWDSALAGVGAGAGGAGIPSGLGRLIHIGIGAVPTGGVTRGGDTMLLHATSIGITSMIRPRSRTRTK